MRKTGIAMGALAAGTAVAVVAAGVLVAAGDGDGSGSRSLGDIRLASSVEAYGGCEELLVDLRAGVDASGTRGLREDAMLSSGAGEQTAVARDGAAALDATTAAPSVGSAGAAAGQAEKRVSQTNVQEAGVDEPDLVKASGDRMLVVTRRDGVAPDGQPLGPQLRWIDISGEQPALAGTLDLPTGFGEQLLVEGDRALVLLQGGGPVRIMPTRPAGGASMASPLHGFASRLVEVDLSGGPLQMAVARTTDVEGDIVTARLIDGDARVVVTGQLQPDVRIAPDGSSAEAYDEAMRKRTEAIKAAPAEAWLPVQRSVDGVPPVPAPGTGSSEPPAGTAPAVACDAIARPVTDDGATASSAIARPVLTSIWTVDLDDPSRQPAAAASVLGGGETVYASATSLYLAATEVEMPEPLPGREGAVSGDTVITDGGRSAPGRAIVPPQPPKIATTIHRFDLTDASGAAHRSTGSVEGRPLNQYSLSEHEGDLRIATTTGEGSWDPATGRPMSESQVVVLREDGDRLVERGRVGGLGVGERIYAVRFLGDIGFVVTFRQTDPLYAIDLRDPSAPKLAGELKIPGFSSYLHPIGDGRLLGVGQDATDQGRVTGSQVSLFDVGDLANPKRVAQLDLGYGNSEVETDPHAFLWDAESALAVMPLSTYDVGGRGAPFQGAVGIRVGSSELSEAGRISHPATQVPGRPGVPTPMPMPVEPDGGIAVEPGIGAHPHVVTPQMRRAVVVGDRLLTVSNAGVMTSRLGDLGQVAWLAFP